MQRCIGIIGAVALIVIGAAPAMAQSGKIIIKGPLILKQPSECDAMCQLQGKVSQLASQLETVTKENAKLQTELATDEKQLTVNSFKIVGMEFNLKTVTSKVETELSDDTQKVGVHEARLVSLEGTAERYKTHTHTLSGDWGFTKQGNFLMVFVGSKASLGPTSGPKEK